MENNAASGRGGGGRSYIMFIANHQRYVVRSISKQGLSFKCVALCIHKFTIYIKTFIEGTVWHWYSLIIFKHVCKTKSVN